MASKAGEESLSIQSHNVAGCSGQVWHLMSQSYDSPMPLHLHLRQETSAGFRAISNKDAEG